MNWFLERLEPNSIIGMTAGVDFFDGLGVLLLRKGQLITGSPAEARSLRLEKTGKT